MRLAVSTLFLFAAVAARAQTILTYGNDALPTCAQGCTLLQQAQSACVPPAAPVTDQTTYESCFCQSGYLSGLKTSSAGLCDSTCGTADLQKIQSWYISYCQSPGAVVNVADVATTAGATTVASTVAGTAASTQSATSTAAATSSGHESW